jgi:hypothetical protein
MTQPVLVHTVDTPLSSWLRSNPTVHHDHRGPARAGR